MVEYSVWFYIYNGNKFKSTQIEEIPSRCRDKMVGSTGAPVWATFPAKGGYTVESVLILASTIDDDASRSRKEGGSNRKLILYRERLCQVPQSLLALVSAQSLQLQYS